jgi:histidine ammonia-lyase
LSYVHSGVQVVQVETVKRLIDFYNNDFLPVIYNQALFFRNQKTSSFLISILSSFRSEIPKVTEDRVLHNDIEKAIKFIQTLELENEVLFD